MKKAQIFLAIITLIILTSPHSALGKDGKGGGSDDGGRGRSKVEIRIEDDEEEEAQEQQLRVRISDERFEIRGMITSVLQPSPTPSPTSTSAPTATSSAVTRVRAEIKTAGTAASVTTFLEQVLTFLKTLLG
ncbi:hypothetical protein HYW42_05320 [Candidatus Daviesbacteria bacterium]|nr:hypothetical protein [Candidatus Daviesbacteria bacterium]